MGIVAAVDQLVQTFPGQVMLRGSYSKKAREGRILPEPVFSIPTLRQVNSITRSRLW